MFNTSRLVILLEWELMSTLAENVSIATMVLKFIAKKVRLPLLMVSMRMELSQKADILAILLSMKGKHYMMHYYMVVILVFFFLYLLLVS